MVSVSKSKLVGWTNVSLGNIAESGLLDHIGQLSDRGLPLGLVLGREHMTVVFCTPGDVGWLLLDNCVSISKGPDGSGVFFWSFRLGDYDRLLERTKAEIGEQIAHLLE